MKQFIVLLVVFMGVFTTKTNAQQQYPSPQQAYWNAFNQRMAPVYNGARRIQQVSNAAVNYGSRIVPQRYGTPLRVGYNQAQQYVQRNVVLPRAYYPNQSGY
jgi:hypothetical protein